MINTARAKRAHRSVLQKKILLLLFGGIALGCTRNPNQYFRVVREISKEWEEINRNSLSRSVNTLYKSGLVITKNNQDGALSITLSKKGERLAKMYDIYNMVIKTPPSWDKKWRVVMFDVPEKFKRTRDSLRMHFKSMGFYEFQKSVFVHPYPCAKEIMCLMEFYESKKYIRFIVATEIDNSRDLKKHFNLN